jgi:putative flippase GtrA
VTERRPDILDRLAAAPLGPAGRVVRPLIATEQGRYLIVGGAVSLCYLVLVALGLALGLEYLLAIAAAQVVTIAVAFPSYRTLAFRSSGPVLPEFARFLSVWSVSLVVVFTATPLLVELTPTPPLLVQVLLVVVAAIGSFLGHRFFSFRSRQAHH